MTNRLESIDIVRGITILMVVGFHAEMPREYDILKSVRMPLFFLVSGYLFSLSKYYGDIKKLLTNKFWTLIVPYFSAGLFTYLFCYIVSYIGRDKPILKEHIYGMINGNGFYLENVPIWFLTCLFSAQIILYLFLSKLNRSRLLIQVTTFFLLGILGVLISKFIYLPWGIDIALASQPFLFVGYKLKELKLLESKINKNRLISLITIVLFIVSIYFNSPTDMNIRSYHNLLWFYISGITGSLIIIKSCELIIPIRPLVKILSFVGKESLIILTMHYVFGFIIVKTVSYISFGVYPNWYLSAFFSVLICLITNFIIKKIPILDILFNGKILQYNKKEIFQFQKVLSKT